LASFLGNTHYLVTSARLDSAPLSVTPIVLLSLPRSGSTLVQRVLAAHEGVATASEPWLLLPLLLPLRNDVPAPGGWQPRIHEALSDFSRTLPDGINSYERSVGDAARTLYEEAADGARFYLDKTPPYFLVIDEIAQTLPEARIVVLWRNPLAVLASVVETFCDGRWRPQDYPTSLFGGLTRLVDGVRRHGERIHAVRYEDLLAGGEGEWRRLAEFVGLEFDPTSLARFPEVRLDGAMGDPVGTKAYSRLESAPTEKWRKTISNPLRRAWARRYLEWIGDERLALMGYERERLLAELAATQTSLSHASADVRDAATSIARDALKIRFARHGSPESAWAKLLRERPSGGQA
jgi:sulfotransferase family protein